MIYHTHNDYCYEKWIKTQQNLDSFIRQNNLTGPMASSTNFQDDVRKWFTEISPDERAAALGFYADNTIVALLSSALSASSSTETTNNCLSSRTADKLESESYDWEAKIALKIIEKTWEEIMLIEAPNTSGDNQKECINISRKSEKEKLKTNDNISINNVNFLMEEDGEKEEEKTWNDKIKLCDESSEASDLFRIPHKGSNAEGTSVLDAVTKVTYVEPDSKSLAIKNTHETRKGELKNIGVGAENLGQLSLQKSVAASSSFLSKGIKENLEHCPDEKNTSKQIAKVIMDNTCCIFPSATKIAATTGGNTSERKQLIKQPFITIHPSYLDSISGEDLFLALDEILAMTYVDDSNLHSFILPESTSDSWMKLIQSYATDDITPSSSTKSVEKGDDRGIPTTLLSVPLFMLVVSHFQLSLLKSYSAHLSSQVTSPSSKNICIDDTTKNGDDGVIRDGQHNGEQPCWLSIFMDRIRELKVVENLRLNFPKGVRTGKSSKNAHIYDLEEYLLVPLTVLFEHLGSGLIDNNITDGLCLLNDFDSSVESCLPNDWVLVKDGLPDELDIVNTDPLAHAPIHINDGVTIVHGKTTPSDVNNEFVKECAKSTLHVTGNKKNKRKKKKKKKKAAPVSSEITKPKTEELPVEMIIEEKKDNDKVSVETSSEELLVEESDTKKVEVEFGVGGLNKEPISTDDIALPEVSTVAPIVSLNSNKSPIFLKSPEDKVTAEIPEVVSADDASMCKSDIIGMLPTTIETQLEEVAKSGNVDRIVDAARNNDDVQDEHWETVEVRPRVRKKISEKGGTFTTMQQSGNGKKRTNRSRKDRHKYQTRKVVKELLNGVFDNVDEQGQQKRQSSKEQTNIRKNQVVSSTKKVSEVVGQKILAAPLIQGSNMHKKNGGSMRDVLVGVKSTNSKQHCQKVSTAKMIPSTYSDRARSSIKVDSKSSPHVSGENRLKSNQILATKVSRITQPLSADQNTIPTVASTNSAFTPSITNVTQRNSEIVQSLNSSCTESVEVPEPKNEPSDTIKHASPSPPLPTLLSPENNNSTSSSVASSLDAPHSGHHRNLSRQSENDVGCHLLDVCDRLSNEISEFMTRREDALTIRRRERGLVLAALEKTLGLIWSGMPSVEMYGSCATNLDLPSSDLDVVVCGLDRPLQTIPISPNSASIGSKSMGESSAVDDYVKKDGSPKVDSPQELPPCQSDQSYSSHQMSPHHMQMMYGHMSVNAERVLRLAMELEHQPWAVHVKAIPTASVPVIKILADPAKLQSAVTSGTADWLVQQPINRQSSPSISHRVVKDNLDSHSGNQAPIPQYSNQKSSLLWRGADVVNGLLKVDITFEGPEHGGIGSTVFSKKVVQDFSDEIGLRPECTPQVQVLMVLKELLAQRRLNEPFLGGLSSYALLLLLISMIGERSIIREELDKTELQRKLVAAGGGNSALRLSQFVSSESTIIEKRKQNSEESQETKIVQIKHEDIRPKAIKTTTLDKELRVDTRKLKYGNLAHTAGKSTTVTEAKGKLNRSAKKVGGSVVFVAKSLKAADPSSWAVIAGKSASTPNLAAMEGNQDNSEQMNSEIDLTCRNFNIASINDNMSKKPNSFADAVAKGKSLPVPKASFPKPITSAVSRHDRKKPHQDIAIVRNANNSDQPPSLRKDFKDEKVDAKNDLQLENVVTSPEQTEAPSSVHSLSLNQSKITSTPTTDTSSFPQGFHDVVEVLSSGDTTSGKLLMHFLLFYGQHFESQSTAIDYSQTHQRDFGANNGYSIRSSYLQRRNAGFYDPITGMLTVDPIVVYDPLEGAESNNVARSCFAWSSIRWVFAQSYMTLSSAAETNATSNEGPRHKAVNSAASEGPAYGHDESGHVVVDPSSPLLELLLSF